MEKKFKNVKSNVLARIYNGELKKKHVEYKEFVTEAKKYVAV